MLAQPGNDNPCGAQVIVPGAGCTNTTSSNVAATTTPPAGIPAPGCASYSGGDVWFSLTIPAGGTVTVTTSLVTGSGFTDSGVALYTGAACAGPFTLAGCNDDFTGLMSQLTYTGGIAGNTLWIRVWEYGNDVFGAFNICATLPPPPASNDDPCQFIPLPTNTTCVNTAASNIGTTATTTPAIPAPGCGGYSGGDVWFQVTVPAAGTVTVTTSISGASAFTDGGMAFYTSPSCSAGPFTLVSCNDDAGFFNYMPALTYTGPVGTVLWVRVWEYGNNSIGAFNICATAPGPPPPPPTNNEPCTAFALTQNPNCSYTTYTNTGATNSSTTPTPACGNFGAGSLDVWFSFVAPPTGIAIIQTQAGTLTDGAMALYEDPPPANCAGPFNLVNCDDDSGPGLMPYMSLTNLTPGTTYYLRIWGYGSATGTFDLCLTGPTALPTGQCTWMLELFDSWGDGWGSSFVSISINGGAAVSYTVGGSYNMALLGLNNGDIITVTYNNSGANQTDNSFRLNYMPSGVTVFNSGIAPANGPVFAQTVSCTPPPAPPQDCSGAVGICSGISFNNNSNNTGNVVDLNAANEGCLSSGERQGTWYYFSPSSSGTIGFTIAPIVATDYDFAVWGPLSSIACPPAAPPLRCSYSALYVNTGLGNGAADPTENAGGDAWVSTMNVTAGQIYLMYIDNFSINGQAFDLTWQLSNGASLDCTLLPLQLVDLHATAIEKTVRLDWSMASELDNDRFDVERSTDGEAFITIGSVPSVGNSSAMTSYGFTDDAPRDGVNYYRLRQVDNDDHAEHSQVVTARFAQATASVQLLPNPGNDLVQVLRPKGAIGATLFMLDATGRTVLRERLNDERTTLNTTDLARGAYALRLVSADGVVLATGAWMHE
ncbi:MAG TPA: T9SS type A sorting domain-containing protein [Flavobacteriales bacterium]|nr:T9SS type A sorting domain-containing protein [Flavobacteriales bacterium]